MRSLIIAVGITALATSSLLADPGGGKGQGKPDKHHDGGGGPAKIHGNKGGHQAEGSRHNGKPDHMGNRGKGHDAFANRDVRYIDDMPGHHRGGHMSFANGCPPGLAKKFNGCQPPGQAKKHYTSLYDNADWWGLSGVEGGNSIFRDGYLLLLGNAGRISGFVPLLGGALAAGNPWPEFYQSTPLAPYQVDYYHLGSPDSYRFADGVIYNVDPKTAAITSVAALLTGDKFNVGALMPEGYQVYNVPQAFRSKYQDSPEANYRYADGYVYQVDPTTKLIESAIQLVL